MKLQLPAQPFDPQLKAAMEEVKALAAKYNIAAIVLLQSPTHGEYLLELSPTWSCATVEADAGGLGIRIRALRADYPTIDEWKEKVRVTTSMLCGFADLTAHANDTLTSLLSRLAENLEIEHVGKIVETEKRRPGIEPGPGG